MKNLDNIQEILDSLAAQNNLRSLRTAVNDGKYVTYDGVRYVNMSSNDYLGLSGQTELQRRFLERAALENRYLMSNSASRLITGNSTDYDALESSVAALYGGKSCIVAGNGYLVNTGVLPAVTARMDLILADKYVHASIIDGLRLCEREWKRFRHNDMDHLESLLRKEREKYENVWVVTESVFSMDGDRAPLRELVALKKRYDLRLYLDEAHAFGVYGASGAGCATAQKLDTEFDVIVATFGKAMASFGAFVACEPRMRELLVNKMRTLIFSTALPPLNLQWTRMLVEMLPDFAPKREHLQHLVQKLAPQNADATHIIPIIAGGNSEVVAMSAKFREAGFWVTPIRYPTVPRGQERIRISLSAALEEYDIDRFIEVWKSIG